MRSMRLSIASLWYKKTLSPLLLPFLPLAWLFGLIVAIRRFLYSNNFIKKNTLPVPVVVVGNIVVGGTGKTPFVIWLAHFLRASGYKPGIVSRGYGGEKHFTPHRVLNTDSASQVGDEPLLLARRSACPVVISIDRSKAAASLLQQSDCNIIICDDGLQHYRLDRQIEIALIDGKKRFGNKHLLPVGPLREPISRLNTVDIKIVTDGNDAHELNMLLEPDEIIALKNQQKLSLAVFLEQHKKIHAVAGIGHPQRFFSLLKKLGFILIEHAYPDHYRYQASDLCFADKLPIVMTEKDAVKCEEFADERYWYLPITANIGKAVEEKLLKKLKSIEVAHV